MPEKRKDSKGRVLKDGESQRANGDVYKRQPSFLMAYGDETVTLANFDQIIPDKVFQEVTSITLEQIGRAHV